jgi:hypothetical protein
MGAIGIIWLLWLCRIAKVFNDKNASLMHGYTPFMWVSTVYNHVEHRDLFTEISTRLGMQREIFFPT